MLINFNFLNRIAILANKFDVIFTGLKRQIGAPSEFNKIEFDKETLANLQSIDVSIPIKETVEGADAESEIDLQDALEDGDVVNSFNDNGQQKLSNHMDNLQIKSQSSMSTTS